MLISKFQSKFGKEHPDLKSYIDNEVQRFMSANRLTETNLKDLDQRICTEKFNIEKKAAIKADRAAKLDLADAKSETSKANKNRPQTAVPKKDTYDDLKSQQSINSRGSKAAPVEALPEVRKDFASKASSVMTKSEAPAHSDSELDEEDEWSAI